MSHLDGCPVLPEWQEGETHLGSPMWWSVGESGRAFSIYLSPITNLYVLKVICDPEPDSKHESLEAAQKAAIEFDRTIQEEQA